VTEIAAQIETAGTEAAPEAGLFIGGVWRHGSAGTFAVENPATEEVLAHVSGGSPEGATSSVDSAAQQLPQWSSTPPRQRSEVLTAIYESMLRNTDDLAESLVSDPSAPFGGLQQSGLGREGARAELHEYLETRYFSVAW